MHMQLVHEAAASTYAHVLCTRMPLDLLTEMMLPAQNAMIQSGGART